jgi:hypothetical protein
MGSITDSQLLSDCRQAVWTGGQARLPVRMSFNCAYMHSWLLISMLPYAAWGSLKVSTL